MSYSINHVQKWIDLHHIMEEGGGGAPPPLIMATELNMAHINH